MAAIAGRLDFIVKSRVGPIPPVCQSVKFAETYQISTLQSYQQRNYEIENPALSKSSTGPTRAAAHTTVVLAAVFLFLLSLLHILEPEFDPSWRMISEYEIGRYGWLMTLAFFCWGGSVLALDVALWPSLRTAGGKIGRGWLVLIVVALLGAGIFKTNAITDTTPGLANSLHTLCGTVVIMTFPVAASLIARSLARNPEWTGTHRRLFWWTLLVWLSMLTFFGSIIISQAINPAAGRVGPEVYLGWPNRVMVAIYTLWLIIVALQAARIPGRVVG